MAPISGVSTVASLSKLDQPSFNESHSLRYTGKRRPSLLHPINTTRQIRFHDRTTLDLIMRISVTTKLTTKPHEHSAHLEVKMEGLYITNCCMGLSRTWTSSTICLEPPSSSKHYAMQYQSVDPTSCEGIARRYLTNTTQVGRSSAMHNLDSFNDFSNRTKAPSHSNQELTDLSSAT